MSAALAPPPSPAQDEVTRVSTLELFFDLVFVFTITQLTTALSADLTGRGLLRVALMLGVIWYMYGGYAWLTNAVAPDRAGRRALLLGGMAAFLVLALTIPQAFAGGGRAFALAYLATVVVHAVLFTRAGTRGVVRAMLRLAPFNLSAALLVLLGGMAGGTVQYGLWALALVVQWVVGPALSVGGFAVAPAHFVERHGLVVLIALGESVVAVGMGLVRQRVDAPLAGVAVLGLLLNACLWWAYFGGDERGAERALETAPRARRPVLALVAFGYGHLPLLLGVIAMATALRRATGHAVVPLDVAHALALGGGAGLFLVGEAFFRRTLGLGSGAWRAGMGLAALATIPLGLAVSAGVQLAALVGVLGAGFAVEDAVRSRRQRRHERGPDG